MQERERLKSILMAHRLTPNRALGQNFLCSDAVIGRIVDAADIDGMPVLEIGPGLGALTAPLTQRASAVNAVEKDAHLADILRAILPSEKLTVLTADFLDVALPEALLTAPFAAVGNLPYYVTTPISERLVTLLPRTVTLMVQSEAAMRFFAHPTERVYGPLSIVTQLCYTMERVLDVPADCFLPAPDVSSSVLHFVKRPDAPADPAALLRFCKRAFAMRRKTLKNNLGGEVDGLADWLRSLGLPENVRAEALPPEALYALFLQSR